MAVTEPSTEFLEGYGASAKGITRMRNPFERLINNEVNPMWSEWHEGWNTRFHGETIYEEESNDT